MKPDRVVVGVRKPEVGEVLRELYAPFLRTERPFLVMSPESAEMTKYAANAMLATKISFINEMANLCDRLGADINDVRKGIGHDQRIGFQFLFPGPGYGGSCFPKDVRGDHRHGPANGPAAEAHAGRGRRQRRPEAGALREGQDALRGFSGRQDDRGLWGLAFKPRTDDIREAPALALIDALLEAGAKVRVHDPEAMANVREIYGDKLYYCRPAVRGAGGSGRRW